MSLWVAGCSGSSGSAAAPAAAPGSLSVLSASAAVVQSAGMVTVTVGRSGGTSGTVTATYTTADGTAVAGMDYTRTSGTLTWADGDATQKIVTIAIATAPGFDGTRTFALTLSAATGGASLGTSSEGITITGSGAPSVISLSAASGSALQTSGSVAVTFTRTGSKGAVTAQYLTQSVTAVQGVNFIPVSYGNLSWADGDISPKTVYITLNYDPPFGGTLDFLVELSYVSANAVIGRQQEDISITGRGSPGNVALATTAQTVSQTGSAVTLTFTRTGGSTGAVSATFVEDKGGTAVSGTDFTGTTGTMTWADGDATNKTATIPLLSTPYYTGTRSFTVQISGSTLAGIGNAFDTITISGAYLPPANYFAFSGATYTWKVQLPIDQYGGTGGTGGIQYPSIEESNAQINAGFVDPYFYADTATYGGTTNHVIFTAPSNGASTTPGSGSDHTRSELRELYNGTGADSNGDWTSSIGGTLTASCVVNSVSVDSDEATIGQIHNQSYVFALLLYRPGSKDIAFDLYTTYGGSAHVRTSMVTVVNLGDAVAYTINYKGNSIVVTVNGTTKTFAVDASWAGTPMYFKLGAYHAAPNTGNPAADQTQVAFGSFAVTH